MPQRFYITTPIYYSNGEPHLGHVYSTVACDAVARYHRLADEETFFLTGTDEHGIKMVKTAADAGVTPKELSDRYAAAFESVWKELKLTPDDFIRTTQDRHKLAVQQIVRKLQASGEIYLGSYAGWYDEGQEQFVTETEAKTQEYKSLVSGKPLVQYSESSYFFKLAKYIPKLLEHIEAHPRFIQPDSRRNEVLSKLRQGVEDLSISRATLKWGIPMPDDAEHVVYVWIDALTNYITALGYGSEDDSLFKKFWPANVHLIGKEILWFHAVYWPAMLLALGLEIPKILFAHGWWTSGGRKMSKSLGNFIDLEKIRQVIQLYSLDALRYYLIRVAPFGSDLDWTESDLLKSYNELKNVLGNGLNRTIKMIERYRGGKLPKIGELQLIDRDLLAKADALPKQLAEAYGSMALQTCALAPIELARAVNGYIDATEPFKLAKGRASAERLDTVLAVAAKCIRETLLGLRPILPEKAELGLAQAPAEAGMAVGPAAALFPNLEPAKSAEKPA